MMTTASCETFGSTLCAEVGGTPKAGFCNTNGLFCSAMNLSVANECARDSDCIDPVRPTYCCDFETQKFKTFCDNIDTAKLETYLADSTSCHDPDCISWDSCHDPECINSPPFTNNDSLSGSGSGGSDDGPPPFTDLDFDPADGCVTESEFDARKGDEWPLFGDIAGFAEETDSCEGITEADLNAFAATQAGGGSGCGSGSCGHNGERLGASSETLCSVCGMKIRQATTMFNVTNVGTYVFFVYFEG